MNNKKTLKWIIGVAAACILLYLGLQHKGVVSNAFSWVFSLIAPLVAGLIIALILNVPMSYIEKRLWPKAKKKGAQNIRRPVAIILSIIVILGIVAGVIGLVVPALVDAIKLIVNAVIGTITTLSNMTADEIAELPLGSIILNIDWDSIAVDAQNWLKTQSGNIMNSAVGTIGSVLGGVIDAVFAIIFSIYLLSSKEKLKGQTKRLVLAWFPEKFANWFIHACRVLSKIFRNFVAGQTLEALILGTLCMIGMLILGIPYAPMVGALVGVTALIPIVGGFVGAGVGAFVILTVSPIKALIFIVFLVILQQIEGNLIYPKVMGNKVNLPAIWVLAAVTVGGGLAGPIGMLLGVPFASTAYVLIREATEKREQNNDNI